MSPYLSEKEGVISDRLANSQGKYQDLATPAEQGLKVAEKIRAAIAAPRSGKTCWSRSQRLPDRGVSPCP